MRLAPAARIRIGKHLRLLGTDKDGELVANIRALGRVLAANKLDWHDLAAIVEALPLAPNRDHFDDDPSENWEGMVADCAAWPELFNAKEWRFIETLQGWYGEPSDKQIAWLTALFARVRRAA